ncbi:hypothetical protein ZIOFF_043145 [Zingiber officinale]|uniref:Cyclin C-terminal domain-containing protein n=1 Tax=Zingiber officinale TaxID=94328 RepID=A0A8J5KW27_ZINOF|nr:hypothetical protein ZIOFF_043145 [Zingiber officinale]
MWQILYTIFLFVQQNEWALQLLSVACLSLATKMEEALLPSLLDLQVEGAKLIFEPRTVLRMELLVLAALDWRLRSVTPFTFIDFFVHKIDPIGKHARYLIAWATEITLATIKDIRFLSHCPSSLAAAAIIRATDEIKDLDSINPVTAASWCIGLSEEGIANCYQSLEKDIINNSKTPHMVPNQELDVASRQAAAFLPLQWLCFLLPLEFRLDVGSTIPIVERQHWKQTWTMVSTHRATIQPINTAQSIPFAQQEPKARQ